MKFKQQQTRLSDRAKAGSGQIGVAGSKGPTRKGLREFQQKVVIFKKLATRVKTKEPKVAKKEKKVKLQDNNNNKKYRQWCRSSADSAREPVSMGSIFTAGFGICCCYSLQTGFSGV